MVTTFFFSMFILTLWYLVNSSNPLKASVFLLLLSAAFFFFLSVSTGVTWVWSIIFLIFMGGILMIFLIISSISPNESPNKIKNLPSVMFLLIITTIFNFSINKDSSTHFMVNSSWNLMMFCLLIFLYFMVFVEMMKFQELPLRAVFCLQSNDFVSRL